MPNSTNGSNRPPRAFVLSLLILLGLGLNLLLAACVIVPTQVIAPTPTPEPSGFRPSPPVSSPAAQLTLPVVQAALTSSRSAYTGWAIDAYPDMSYQDMLTAVRRMKDAGANVVWISHANPARSFQKEREVGLSPAVYDAFRNPTILAHLDAIAIVEAEKRMLKACKEVGLKAVLSIGYHTQMGLDWSASHPQDLRRKANGKVWQIVNGNDPYASPYSPTFQKDLREYYVWIEYEFLNQFRDTVMMLNLADEPLGGDYSGWAEAAFRRRVGYGFGDIGTDPARQIALGQFQAGVVVDFMRLGADYWNDITPGLPVTMSFDGGAMREDNGLPNLENLFRQAPANFVLTWDMYPRDRGTLDVSVKEEDLTRLFFLTRQVAGYSAQYSRKVWLWSAANSWGLGQGVPEPGTIADAQANLLYLAGLMAGAGGRLEGLAVWNYNIKTQGLYNYSFGDVKQKATWNEDDMFNRVSSQFAAARALMMGPLSSPQVLFLRAPESQYRQIGAGKIDYWKPELDWAGLDVLARNGIVSVEVGHWPTAWPEVWANLKTVIVLSSPEFLNQADLKGLHDWLGGGGQVVASLGLAQTLTGSQPSLWNGVPAVQTVGKGRLFISREPTGTLFDSSEAATLKSFWQDLLGLKDLNGGYIVRTATSYLQYHLNRTPIAAPWPNGWESVQRYRADGQAQVFNRASWPGWALQRSEYVFAMKEK